MYVKLLVVDDEPDVEFLIKQKFREEIRQKDFEFIFARNGIEALEKLNANPDVDIILSDIKMPDMDGLTLLKETNKLNPLLKTIIVSAYGDMENIRFAMNKGAFDFITKPIDFNDLMEAIIKTINHVSALKETVRAIKENNILRMYVDDNVLRYLTGEEFEKSLMVSEIINATVCFIDICGFTYLSENLPVDTVVNLVNEYFDIIANKIIENNGVIDKFIGDGMMVVFREASHLERAIKTSLSIRKIVEDMSKNTIDGKLSYPNIAIGLHTGDMILGNIGSQSLKKFDHTVMGSVVNTAASLQNIASDTQIVITKDVYLTIKDTFNCELLGSVKLKNRQDAIIIYNIIE